MISNSEIKSTLESIFAIELKTVAYRLGFINAPPDAINDQLLHLSFRVIDHLSRKEDDLSKKIVVYISSILWTYKNEKWDSLYEFLILILSRIGFAPSAIMVDIGYENGRHSPLISYINQLFVALYHFEHQVTIKDTIFQLTTFQKNVWDKIESNSILGISAPTSAGKSFIIYLKIIDLLLRSDGLVIYIVPTLSLVSQVSIDLRKMLHQFNLNNYEILNTYIGNYTDYHKIFVLTQEKAIAAFSQNDCPFTTVRALVVEEIQNIERVADEDDQRSKTLYDLLVEFRYSCNPDKIIISGPRIDKIGLLGIDIFGQETIVEETNSSPVINITYAISKIKNEYYFKQYIDVLDHPLSIAIINSDKITGHGKIQYRDNFHEYLDYFIKNIGENNINIIFSPKPSQARKTAIALANKGTPSDNELLNSLITYLHETVHIQYDQCSTLRNGYAYHHGRLPHHVRRVLEHAIGQKIINNIVCTTTLMQGVNLPAQNVIIRNPNLFVKRSSNNSRLTSYEIANLRGRAGRLLKDLIGRTFVLDENSFVEDETDQLELFTEATKEIHVGYGDRFNEYKTAIEQGLLKQETPSDDNKDYSFLLTYIRQTILKYSDEAINRLKTVGIVLDNNKFNEISNQLRFPDKVKSVCFKNRYWDPIDINTLTKTADNIDIPKSVNQPDIAYRLKEIMLFFKNNYNHYYKRYINIQEIKDRDMILSLCINAEHWLKEVPLKIILDTEYHNNSDNIESTINLLQNKISFGLPMLLKPLYDIKTDESNFLRFIELGAFNPITRRLIEFNIPRETSIYLFSTYLKTIKHAEDIDQNIISELQNIYGKLNYWVQIQLEAIV